MAPLCRTRLVKQAPPQRKRKQKETSNHDYHDENANTSSSLNNNIHDVTTTDSHDSDNNDNDSNEDCKNPKPNSTNEQETTNNNDDNANNGNSGQHYHQNDIGAINDYISITDQQDSISSLTTETASLTVFVHELFQMKKIITDNNKLSWNGKIATFFYEKCHILVEFQQQWWGGVSAKVQKALDNKRSTVAMAIKIEFMHKSKFIFHNIKIQSNVNHSNNFSSFHLNRTQIR